MPNFSKSTNNNWNILSTESKKKYAEEYETNLLRIAAIENEFPEEKYMNDPAYLRYKERVHELRKMFGHENIGPDKPIESRKARLERLRREKHELISKIRERNSNDIEQQLKARDEIAGSTVFGGIGSTVEDWGLNEFDQRYVDQVFPELFKESPWYYDGIYKNNILTRDLAKLLYGEKTMESTTDETVDKEGLTTVSIADCKDNTKVCNRNIPNDVYTFSINLKVNLPRERVIVDEGAFDGNEDKVAEAYFDKDRVNALKLKLITEILNSECPFDFNCVDQDGGLRVTEDMLFRVNDNKKG